MRNLNVLLFFLCQGSNLFSWIFVYQSKIGKKVILIFFNGVKGGFKSCLLLSLFGLLDPSLPFPLLLYYYHSCMGYFYTPGYIQTCIVMALFRLWRGKSLYTWIAQKSLILIVYVYTLPPVPRCICATLAKIYHSWCNCMKACQAVKTILSWKLSRYLLKSLLRGFYFIVQVACCLTL